MRLRLETVEYKHLGWLRNQRNRKDVMDFCRQPFFLNEISQEDWLKKVTKERIMTPFIISDQDLKEGYDWIGYGALSNFDWVSRKAEISYFTIPEHKDNGYGEESIYMILEYGFRRLNLHKIYSDVFTFNVKELDFMKRCGFKESGILIDHYFKRGKFQDSVIIHILEGDFYERYRDKVSDYLSLEKELSSKPI